MIDKNQSCLYRDDGLILLRNVNGPVLDFTRKDMIKVFKDLGFKMK